MGKVFFRFAIVAGFAASEFFAIGPAAADPYKWCAQYSGNTGRNCGFVTIEQCRATVSGIGGFCEPNPFYTPTSQKPARQLRMQDKRMEIAPSGDGYSAGGGYSLFATPGNPSD